MVIREAMSTGLNAKDSSRTRVLYGVVAGLGDAIAKDKQREKGLLYEI
jgi:hypothetical protein